MPVVAQNRYCPRCGLATSEPLCARDGTSTIERSTIDLAAVQLRPGDVLASRYRIIKQLGRGGFGAVFSAEHTGTGQKMALKLLTADPVQGGEDAQRRFFREAAITAQLRHPNTVRVHDFGQAENGVLFMALELIDGPTLAQRLRDFSERGQAMPEVMAIDMATAVLRSLGEAHTAQLVHRDLKPANIMYASVPGEEPVLKVLDFGIVRARDSSLTASGTALGTPEYMSPEQCSGEPMDGRSDLYSLGIILFECLTGRQPFTDENALRVMMMHLQSPAPDVRCFARTAVSDGLADIIAKALAKNPMERFSDAREMRAVLEAQRPTVVQFAKQPPQGLAATVVAQRPRSEQVAPETPVTGTGMTARTPLAGPSTLAQAAARTQAQATASKPASSGLFSKREVRIAALGAAAAVLVFALVGGGYWLASHQGEAKGAVADSATDVAEEALEPVAAEAVARFASAQDGATVRDNHTKLTWQRAAPPYVQTAAQAGHYCSALNLAGRGWRLPKKAELLELATEFDASAFPDAPAGWYWTDSPFQGSATNTWGVDFETKHANQYDVMAEGHVRCVR